MNFGLTAEQQAWRDEVVAFLREHWRPVMESRQGLGGGNFQQPTEDAGRLLREFRRKVGEKGWWALNWPKEYGGLEKSAMEKFIFTEEFESAGAPGPSLTMASIAPIILAVGTEENKKQWIPPIASGEYEFAVGYSEPDAGTDLASLKTRAELHGDEWIINGSKIWNSGAPTASHEWLAVRTDLEARKHQGISVIIVPLSSPGITIQHMPMWGGGHTHQTFFEDVRVPKENLIGELNRGWYYIAGALDYERAFLGGTAQLRRTFDALVRSAKTTVINGRTVSSRPTVRSRLAELEMELEIGRLLTLRIAAMIENKRVPTVEGSVSKVFTSELRTKMADWGTQMFGQRGLLASGENAPMGGGLVGVYRGAPVQRFGGGTNEVQRNIIAQRGLGLPRGPNDPADRKAQAREAAGK